MLPRLYYISDGETEQIQLQHIEAACNAGIKLIQLRMKGFSPEEILQAGKEALAICKAHNAILIVNDHPEIAAKIGADGVHVGQKDQSVAEVKTSYGTDLIVGGTANAFEDIQRHVQEGADYIGLGPFRETTTKKELSPVLGLSGYWELLYQCAKQNLQVPIYAIGGIRMNDISELSKTGVHGIAVSSLFNQETDKAGMASKFEEEWIHGTIANS